MSPERFVKGESERTFRLIKFPRLALMRDNILARRSKSSPEGSPVSASSSCVP